MKKSKMFSGIFVFAVFLGALFTGCSDPSANTEPASATTQNVGTGNLTDNSNGEENEENAYNNDSVNNSAKIEKLQELASFLPEFYKGLYRDNSSASVNTDSIAFTNIKSTIKYDSNGVPYITSDIYTFNQSNSGRLAFNLDSWNINYTFTNARFYCYEDNAELKIFIELKNRSLREAFDEIENEGDYFCWRTINYDIDDTETFELEIHRNGFIYQTHIYDKTSLKVTPQELIVGYWKVNSTEKNAFNVNYMYLKFNENKTGTLYNNKLENPTQFEWKFNGNELILTSTWATLDNNSYRSSDREFYLTENYLRFNKFLNQGSREYKSYARE